MMVQAHPGIAQRRTTMSTTKQITYDGIPSDQITQEQLEEYARKHKDDYIKGFDSVSEAVRLYDCLINLVEEGDVTGANLHEYGMSDQDL
jgi:hypothetical protein